MRVTRWAIGTWDPVGDDSDIEISRHSFPATSKGLKAARIVADQYNSLADASWNYQAGVFGLLTDPAPLAVLRRLIDRIAAHMETPTAETAARLEECLVQANHVVQERMT